MAKKKPEQAQDEERKRAEAFEEMMGSAKQQLGQILDSLGVPTDKVLILERGTTSAPDDEEEINEAEVIAACQRRNALLGLFKRETAGLAQKYIDFADELTTRAQELEEFAVGSPATIFGYGRLQQALLGVAIAVEGVNATMGALDQCIEDDREEGYEPEVTSEAGVRYVETKTRIVSCDECPKRATCTKPGRLDRLNKHTLN